MIRTAFPFALILLAGCARSEEASLVPGDGNGAAQAVETVRTPERDEQEIALGDWRESLQEEQSALEFGPSGAAPLFSLRCDDRRAILLQRHGATTAGDLPVMLITIGSDTRRLAVTTAGGAIPMLRASVTASDQLLGILSGASSPINVRVGDAPPLILPPSPAVGAFLGRCASGQAPAAPEADSGDTQAAETNKAAPAAE